ncbi:hypothetical protein PRIPAC_80394 [Pristionchus pacificus]|uniref:Uncharacterized protein n=1 Tax=Pristionchus pacificus TaxID=54126 RepID=A0A2A6CL23_PRIPA|nr:hypothetical protein PRIPAC_80394 [Pristionchus pacificus]|eukprot:PDM78777.1 hypothetical protein PRIPAC_31356 [Pristionchus pacificus]
MNSRIIICGCMLAFAAAMPNMTAAQYDEWNSQAMSRLSTTAQQAWMRMAAMEKQMSTNNMRMRMNNVMTSSGK